MGYKSVDGLMRHLRNNGIKIAGSKQKRQLRNTGYFHGYKGYRFFGLSSQRIPFTTYDEIYATIKYDSKLKALFYEKIMFIETAAKNVALECIMKKAGSESIQDMYKNAVCGYHNAPAGSDVKTKKNLQERKLRLEGMIQSYLSRAYKDGNPKITHFYNNMSYSGVPLWALFEIMTMGDFGYLLSCLTFDTRESISIEMSLSDASVDTNRELIYKYIYTLKDLRNAVAHNSVVFDTRFRKIDPTPAMRKCLMQEFGLPYLNFKTIGDYLILICYYLKIFGVPKTEVKAFIRNFENITDEYRGSVNAAVAARVLHPDLPSRLSILKSQI
ncbi:Abi family protein [Dysosmobacter sp. Sow4_B12]|uniref:Abi family protein n=1 Tax=Dysosmobacter sp. Sow4_B12 TaxID=3438777 RepID=UPI003F91CF90